MRFVMLLLFVVSLAFGVQADSDFADGLDNEYATVQKHPFDPLIGYNRWMTTFNDKLYIEILDPYVYRWYDAAIPKVARSSIDNFFHNLRFPITFLNHIFQLRFKRAWVDVERFGVNTTVGLFGFFDPAFTWLKLQRDDEDFGQTLGYYGVGSGFPIVLPFFGPSNLRDLTGTVVDTNLDPIYYVSYRRYNLLQNNIQSLGLVTFKYLNKGSLNEQEYKNLRKDAVDLYPFLQNAYEQHRKMLIKE